MDVSPHPPPARRDAAALVRLQAVSRAGAGIGLAVGTATLASWMIGLPWVRTAGDTIESQPNAALGVVLAAGAILVGAPGAGPRRRAAAVLLAAATLLLGGLTVLEHLTRVELGIDGLLYPRDLAGAGPSSSGRMGSPAALNLLLAGAALVASHAKVRGGRLAAQVLALCAAPLPVLALVGHAYDATMILGATRLSAIGFPTALALLAVDVGVLLARPDRGFVANLAAPGSGTAIARRMLVYAVALPFALGWLALAASGAGPEGAFPVSIVVAALTLVLVVLVLRDAASLARLDAAKAAAEAEEAASREALARALRLEQEARSLAEAASRAKDEFLNALSHELRTPLNAILGWSRLLREAGGDPDRLARGIAVVDRNGRALAQVVSDLLDMSRIARGVIQIERLEVDVVAAVEAAVDAVRPAAEAKGVLLARVLGERVPRVVGDPGRIQQIAWNLVSNAVKFTPPGGRVEVTLREDGGQPVLTVEDTGIGIPPEFVPHVFERFRQGDGSATRRHGGLGLGLALTRELVGLHGGIIEAASAGPNLGATFRVVLPPAPVMPEAAPPPRRDRLGGARILVVDDEPDSRELLLQLLASWGARATGAASAREALAAAARERPDLLVSDIAMPGEDGCALIQELRRGERAHAQPPVPALALTAFARPEDRRRVLAAGFDAHVAKPIEPDGLLATLNVLLERRSRSSERGPAARTEVRGGPSQAPGASLAASSR